MAHTPQVRTCPVCGKEFTAYVWNKRYCSDECYMKAHALGLKNKRNSRSMTRKCHDCGRPTNNWLCQACWHKRRGFGSKTVQLRGNDGMDTVKPYFF